MTHENGCGQLERDNTISKTPSTFTDRNPYNDEPTAQFQHAVLLQKRHLFTGSMLDLATMTLKKLFIDIPEDEQYASTATSWATPSDSRSTKQFRSRLQHVD